MGVREGLGFRALEFGVSGLGSRASTMTYLQFVF